MRKILFYFILCLLPFYYVNAQSFLLPSRPRVDSVLAPFFHGVASGDPLTDRIIIWTRVTTLDPSVDVDWQMATDTGFLSVVNSGTFTTDSSFDYTVKVDVTGLQPNNWYYYRFKAYNRYSITGRTRTLPIGNVDSLRIAFFSCSDFQAGYFNVYHDIANRNDIDMVMHLGDYYYEYAASASDTNRLHPETHDALSLTDYRLWNSEYKLDPDLRALFQQYPWIQIWDDHDVANNSWETGAQNHNPATQGSYIARKDASFKAYFEWLPIREQAPGNDSIIHRAFKWGNLFNLIMLDTRYEGRDSSLGAPIPNNAPVLIDTNRRMLGVTQLNWFKNELSDTTTQWKIIGNQVMIAPLVGLGLVFNGDQWDGYPAERKRVLNYIMQNNIKDVVFCTGDIHSSWANDIPHPDSTYNSSTGAGSVATEFIGTSVTSTAVGLTGLQTIIQTADPHIKYVDLTKRGYCLLDINKHRVQGDYIHISNDASRVYTTSDDAQWMNLDGERFLRHASSVLGPRTGNPDLVPFITDVSEIKKEDNMMLIGCYPNPAQNQVAVQYYLFKPSEVKILLTDLSGRVVYQQSTQQQEYGLFSTKVDISSLSSGAYVFSVVSNGKTYSKNIIKQD